MGGDPEEEQAGQAPGHPGGQQQVHRQLGEEEQDDDNAERGESLEVGDVAADEEQHARR